MTKLLEQALDAVSRMPPGEQDAIARAMLRLAAPGEPRDVDPGELQDVMEGLGELERGEIATDEEIAAAFRSFER